MEVYEYPRTSQKWFHNISSCPHSVLFAVLSEALQSHTSCRRAIVSLHNSPTQCFIDPFILENTTCATNRVLSGWCWDRFESFPSSPRWLVCNLSLRIPSIAITHYFRRHRSGSR